MSGARNSFLDVLHAEAPASDRAEKMALYGQFIGSWNTDIVSHEQNGTEHRGNGEIHFGWVLEGRAVQDVWILPVRDPRTGEIDPSRRTQGTTLRIWDAALQAWRVTWISPLTGARVELVGRWSGKDVVQVGTFANGTPIRWIFSEITPDSFRWTGETLQADGQTWKLEGEFLAKRIPG